MKYIKSIIIVITLCISVLLGIFTLYKKGYSKYFFVVQKHLGEIINGKTDYDILFIGSSRTFYHVNTRIIDSVTGLNAYNAGIAGANLLEMNLARECYLASHKNPKMIVVDLAYTAFAIKLKPVFDPNIYYNFLDNDIVFKTLRPYKRVTLLKYLPFLQLSESDDFLKERALLGHFGQKEIQETQFHKGYFNVGSDTIKLPVKIRTDNFHYEVGDEGKNILETLIKSCLQRNIKLVFTYAPVYRQMDERRDPNFFPTIERFAATYNIPFLNYQNIELSDKHTLFRDNLHLNSNGVNIYSKILGVELNRLLK